MRVLTRGKTETIVLLRDPEQTLEAATATNPTTGAEISVIDDFDDDDTDVALLAGAEQGDDTLQVTGLVPGTNYMLVSDDGRKLRIKCLAQSATVALLDTRLPYDVDAGSVVGIESTIEITIPATETTRAIVIEATYSDAEVVRMQCLVASRVLSAPVTQADIFARYPRMRSRERGEMGLEEQISIAMDRARLEVWKHGYVMDDFPNPDMLREYLVSEVALLLARAGYDLAGTGDRGDSLREFERLRDREFISLMSARNLWIDANEDNTQNDGETAPIHGIRAVWFRGSGE
jgi:hypothetical protein